MMRPCPATLRIVSASLLCALGLTAGCGGSKGPATGPAAATGHRATAADNQRRKAEQTMTAGVRTDTGHAAVDVRFAIDSTPMAGQPFTLTVAVLPNEGTPSIKVDLPPVDGLVAAPISAPTTFTKVEPGSVFLVPVGYTAASAGIALVTVVVTEAAPTGEETATFQLPVVVDINALAPPPPPGAKAPAPGAPAAAKAAAPAKAAG